MGPETAGLIVLGIIGGTVTLAAWINSGSCKLGRHNWSKWDRPESSTPNVVQERHCTNCNRLEQKLGGCVAGKHDWTIWEKGTDESVFQERHCNLCNKIEQEKQKGCDKGFHDWGPWSEPVYTGWYYKENCTKIMKQSRRCKSCNSLDHKEFTVRFSNT